MKKLILILLLFITPSATFGQCSGVFGPNTVCGRGSTSGPPSQLPAATLLGGVINVKSGANGCAAAVGNGVADDATAIQCQINYIATNFGGGEVFFPIGNYKVGSTITLKGATCLTGTNYFQTAITASGDFTVLTFDGGTAAYSCINNLWFVGFQNASATSNAVVVPAGLPVDMSNCRIWGGNWALETGGIDGRIYNCFIMGTGSSGGGVLSTGANFWTSAKFDTIGFTVSAAFKQGSNATIMENQFTNTDFSLSATNSLVVADTNNKAITRCVNCIFSPAVSVTGAASTIIVGAEFDANFSSSAPISITGSVGITAITVSGAGLRSCAGNINITC